MEIDIKVLEQENSSFLQENIPIWPRVPTSCPVATCEGRQHFKSFQDFLTHWKSVHTEYKTLKSCSCGKMFRSSKHLKCHLKSTPNHQTACDKTVKNLNFMSPGETLPYQLGNKEDRAIMKNLQKDLARRRRREEANKFIEQRNILCSTSLSNVCRDERIVERGVWLVGWLS